MIRVPPVFVTLCLCFVLATGARAETLVVLLEGLGGRIVSAGKAAMALLIEIRKTRTRENRRH